MENTFDPKVWDFQKVLNTSVCYETEVSGKNITAEKNFVIYDVTSPSNADLCIHWNSSNQPEEEYIVLKAEHGEEIRKYRLSFRTQYRYVSMANITK